MSFYELPSPFIEPTLGNIAMNDIPNTEFHQKIRSDFRTFLYLVHDYLALPEPTPAQLDIAKYIAIEAPKRAMVQAFRGVGKSHITSAYVVWRLLLDPEIKIMVVSASKDRADQFSTFTQRLIAEIQGLEYLKPRGDQRNSKIAFDVGPASASHSPSVKSVGITGQLTGSRADLIIADDVEVLNNSATQQMRDKLSEMVKEFDAILKPEDHCRIMYLGTPQCEDSLYNKLPERGYDIRVWPARMPEEKDVAKYGDTLSPFITGLGLPSGTPTDPKRFGDNDLIEREASYGKAGFALQFMLNTQLSDAERYPLKLRDLCFMSCDPKEGPLRTAWGPSEDRVLNDLPNVGMSGDKMYPPMNIGDTFAEYSGCVMSIDPSGRGKDETGYAVIKMLNSTLFVVAAGGLQGGYDDETITELAHIAKKHSVNHVIIESNFGDGMYTKIAQPIFNKVHPTMIEEVRHSTQKERRIIDTIEPVMARHRLIVDPSVVEHDWKTIQKYEQATRLHKSLFYQLTRVTYDKGSLRHDDRLDALAMAVGYWVEQMGADQAAHEEAHRTELLEKELEGYLNNALSLGSPSSNRWM